MGRTIAPLERVGTKRAKFLGKGKWELIANFNATMVRWEVLREKRKVRISGKRKCKLIAKCEFLARESANSSPILARQWWRHFRLSLSLSLSLSHRAHLTHNVGSAYALPIIGPGRIWSFVLGFRSLIARLAPFERVGTKRAKHFLATESVNPLRISAPQCQWWPLSEGRNEKCEFLARESVNSSPMGHILRRGKWRPHTPRWYNAALTHTKWMGNLSSPTLNSNCENRRACFCQTSPGMHVWGVIVPIRTVFMRSNRPRG